MSQQVVCIIHQHANEQPGLVNTSKLVEAGCKLRVSKTCIPDLIMSRAGTTASFLLVANSSNLHPGSTTWERYHTVLALQGQLVPANSGMFAI